MKQTGDTTVYRLTDGPRAGEERPAIVVRATSSVDEQTLIETTEHDLIVFTARTADGYSEAAVLLEDCEYQTDGRRGWFVGGTAAPFFASGYQTIQALGMPPREPALGVRWTGPALGSIDGLLSRLEPPTPPGVIDPASVTLTAPPADSSSANGVQRVPEVQEPAAESTTEEAPPANPDA